MACTDPIIGYRAPGGKVTFVSRSKDSGLKISIACGQCFGCRLDRVNMWTTRLMHELQMTEESGKGSAFITLTYSPENIPSDWGLHVEEWQSFAKRLRDKVGSFRFYMCGEYGEQSKRPHYHAVIFGQDFRKDRMEYKRNARGDRYYLSETLSKTWGKGNAMLGNVTRESAAYVARYTVFRKGKADNAPDLLRTKGHKTWYVRPEFATMSRRPGIGATWFAKYRRDIYPSDFAVLDGKRVRTPKYYDELEARRETAAGQEVSELDKIKQLRKQRAIKRAADLTPLRLQAREEILRRQYDKRKEQV